MLSPDLPAKQDRDSHTRKKRAAPPASETLATRNCSVSRVSNTEGANNVIGTASNQREREALMDMPGGGDIAADLQQESNKENERIVFASPPPPSNKGRLSFEAIDPVNILLPFDLVKATFDAMRQLRTRQEVERLRGVSLS